jgi:hypothetical protein
MVYVILFKMINIYTLEVALLKDSFFYISFL